MGTEDVGTAPHPVTGQPFPSPVPPGTGWPDDPATAATPVAEDGVDVARLAADPSLDELTARVSVCRACPRLVTWREDVAAAKRASYSREPYWGRPIAGWGDRAPAGVRRPEAQAPLRPWCRDRAGRTAR